MNWYKKSSYAFYNGDSFGGFPIYRIYNLEDALSFFQLPTSWARIGIPKIFTMDDLNSAKTAIFRSYRDINVNTLAVLETGDTGQIKRYEDWL